MSNLTLCDTPLVQLRGTESVLAVDDNAEIRELVVEQMTSL